MKKDQFIKLIENNFNENDDIIFYISDQYNFITSHTHIRHISIEEYDEHEHKFIEEKKKVIFLENFENGAYI